MFFPSRHAAIAIRKNAGCASIFAARNRSFSQLKGDISRVVVEQLAQRRRQPARHAAYVVQALPRKANLEYPRNAITAAAVRRCLRMLAGRSLAKQLFVISGSVYHLLSNMLSFSLTCPNPISSRVCNTSLVVIIFFLCSMPLRMGCPLAPLTWPATAATHAARGHPQNGERRNAPTSIVNAGTEETRTWIIQHFHKTYSAASLSPPPLASFSSTPLLLGSKKQTAK